LGLDPLAETGLFFLERDPFCDLFKLLFDYFVFLRSILRDSFELFDLNDELYYDVGL